MEQQLKPLHLACGDDDMRPNLCLIQIKNQIATATNGYMIARINLAQTTALDVATLAILEGKTIHAEVWREIWKCDQLTFSEKQIDCWKNGIHKTLYYSEPNGEFFNTNSIVLDCADGGEEEKRIISYNPKFIAILAKIFQTEILTFSFSKGNKGTFVFPNDTDGMFAVLMPCDSTNLNRYYFN